MLNRVVMTLCLLVMWCAVGVGEEARIEPGPEHGGLRLRLVVTKRGTPREGGFDVRVDVINAAKDKVTLRTGWDSNETGDVKDFLRLNASVETYPPLEPEKGARGAREARTTPQKELTLATGETLTMAWQTVGRKLKNESELFAHNPEFTETGLYSVHFTLNAITATGMYRLRTNEQQVLIGSNARQPRHTYGHITSIGRGNKAGFSLGSLNQVKVGDVFEITSKTGSWRLTVVEAYEKFSEGNLKAIGDDGGSLPEVGAGASLLRGSTVTKGPGRD